MTLIESINTWKVKEFRIFLFQIRKTLLLLSVSHITNKIFLKPFLFIQNTNEFIVLFILKEKIPLFGDVRNIYYKEKQKWLEKTLHIRCIKHTTITISVQIQFFLMFFFQITSCFDLQCAKWVSSAIAVSLFTFFFINLYWKKTFLKEPQNIYPFLKSFVFIWEDVINYIPETSKQRILCCRINSDYLII